LRWSKPGIGWLSLSKPGFGWLSLSKPGLGWLSLSKPGLGWLSLSKPGTGWLSLSKPSDRPPCRSRHRPRMRAAVHDFGSGRENVSRHRHHVAMQRSTPRIG